jgi:hypothetical protein
MRTEQQQLHELYNKHELGPKIYRRLVSVYNDYPALTQCPCGDWLVFDNNRQVWLPLYGHAAADFINANPEIYPALKEYWTRLPKLPAECTVAPWEGIDYNVDAYIKAYYNKTAAIATPVEGEQNPGITQTPYPCTTDNPKLPDEYIQGGRSIYRSGAINTPDNPAAQGTPVAPPNIHNLWGILKDK